MWCAFLLACLAEAGASEFHPSPGNLAGPYDLLGIAGPAEEALLTDGIVLDVSAQRSRDSLGGRTTALVYSGEYPFGRLVTLKVENLCEVWQMSSGGKGTGFGEVAFITKYLLIEETNSLPTLTLKLALKTAAGGGSALRYTDSMGVLFGLMAARDFNVARPNRVRVVRILAEIGLAVWDDGVGKDGTGEQNDAPKYAVAVQFRAARYLDLHAGIHGLYGWRNNGDTPMSANVGADYAVIDNVSACVNVDVGLHHDADDYIISGGLKVRFGREW